MCDMRDNALKLHVWMLTVRPNLFNCTAEL